VHQSTSEDDYDGCEVPLALMPAIEDQSALPCARWQHHGGDLLYTLHQTTR
jgi:hypothetical protein